MPRSRFFPKNPNLKLLLVCRRERWGLTAQGWFLTLFCLVTLTLFSCLNIYPFLAVTQPIAQADALVVEGWITDESLKFAIAEFNAHPYKKLITTGGSLERGSYLSQYETFAALAAATLTKLGVEPDKLVTAPAGVIRRNRTYLSAIALRDWLNQSTLDIRTVNLLTEGVHARRSWTLYRKALEPKVKVGIIAVPPTSYASQKWWTSSAGFKTVTEELISCLYGILFNALD